jgi:hypothetical protein
MSPFAPSSIAGRPRVWSRVRTRQPVHIFADTAHLPAVRYPGRRPKGLGRPPVGFGQSYSPPDYFDTGWASVFVAGCQGIGASPLDVAGLLVSESNFNPGAQNSIGCVGLNQQCPGSQNFLSDMTVAQYLQLTVSEQLPYVFAFWQNWLTQYGIGSISAAELYWLNFLPATFVPNSSSDYVISKSGDPYYSSNTGLDTTGSGQITLGDLQTAIDNAKSNNPDLWSYLEGQILLAGGVFPTTTWTVLGGLVAGVVGFFWWKRRHG